MQVCEIRISDITDGMIVAKDVYTDTNELVLTHNTVLNGEIVKRLKQYGVYRITVYKEVEVSGVNRQPSRVEKVRNSKEFVRFKKNFDNTVAGLKGTFARILESSDIDGVAQLTKQVDTIMRKADGSYHVFDMLNCMREYDDVTFAHSISVSILCNLIGEWLRLSNSDIYSLTMSGILHDIGKMQIPNEIISKPGKLTEEEFHIVQQHPKLGYQILSKLDLDEHVKYAALMHHERCDGKGYPMQIGKNKIDYFSKIVMLADVYDAMTADRSYRKGMCPFKALDIMLEDGFEKYDPAVLMLFVEKTVQSYIGATVLLSDDRAGEIVAVNREAWTRPLIRIKNEFVDLYRDKSIKIAKIV